MKREAYYYKNTPALREWLKEQGLMPICYPDCDREGLTAPYPNFTGKMTMYNDGVRYDTDDDVNDFIICDTEDEFKREVTRLLEANSN